MLELTFQQFLKAVEYVSGKKATLIADLEKDNNKSRGLDLIRFNKVISLSGIWFVVGDINDITEFSIVRINDESKNFSIIKSCRTYEDCLISMAHIKEWLIK